MGSQFHENRPLELKNHSMETFVKNRIFIFSTLLSLFTLAGCGDSGKSKAKLEVSSGFLASNAGFEGGLIISGKNHTTGQIFSVDVVTGVQKQLELPKGQWTFVAVGWDGGTSGGGSTNGGTTNGGTTNGGTTNGGTTSGGTTSGGTTSFGTSLKKFGGVPYCGTTNVLLNASSQTVELNVTPARCGSDDVFASSQFRETSGDYTFLQLKTLKTCNSFYDHKLGLSPATKIADVLYTRSPPHNPTFCTSADKMPLDLQSKIKSFKIHAINKTPDQPEGSLGFSTSCLVGNQDYYPSASGSGDYPSATTPLRLPTKIPLAIEIFNDNACTKSVAKYVFKSGLEVEHPESFDSVFHYTDAGNVLLLPGTDVRRAVSPFTYLMPSFKCHDGNGTTINCPTLPIGPLNTTAPYEYHGINGSSNNELFDSSTKTCAGTYSSSDNSITAITCATDGNGIKLTYSKGTGTNGTVSAIKLNDVITYRIMFTTALPDGFDSKRVTAYSTLTRLIGFSDNNFPRSFFNGSKDDNEDTFGALSQIRDMLDVPGSVIGVQNTSVTFQQNCLATGPTSKTISIYNNERLTFETYKVEIENPLLDTPNEYICVSANPGATVANCTNSLNKFHKEMKIFDYKQSALIPSVKIKFSCSESFGKFISQEQNNENNNRRRSEKNYISWNTQSLDTQRFEKASWQRESELGVDGYKLTNERKSLSRVEKKTEGSYAIWHYGFETRKIGSNPNLWDQRIFNNQYISKDPVSLDPTATICFNIAEINRPSPNGYKSIFTDTDTTTVAARAATPLTSGYATFGLVINENWASQTVAAASCTSTPHVGLSEPNTSFGGVIDFKIDSLNSSLDVLLDALFN